MNDKELTGCGNPFLYQFVNDLGRGFMVGHCLGKKVIDSRIRKTQKAQFPLLCRNIQRSGVARTAEGGEAHTDLLFAVPVFY